MREIFSYDFIYEPLIIGMLVALCAALLGVTLVLKRYSMIGDGLSHVSYGALAVAAAMGVAPLKIAVPVVVLAAFLLLRVSGNARMNGDSAIAMISSTSIAVGVIVASLSGNVNIDVGSYMFGSILAVDDTDLFISLLLSAVVPVMYFLLYNRVFAITFDESFARSAGVRTGVYNMLVALLTAVTIVVGMRIMGAILISSLLIFPALTSMRVFRSFKGVVVSAAIISVVCFFFGFYFSYVFETPTGASVVVTNALAFALFSGIGAVVRRRESSEGGIADN